jgi:hypothetical protein
VSVSVSSNSDKYVHIHIEIDIVIMLDREWLNSTSTYEIIKWTLTNKCTTNEVCVFLEFQISYFIFHIHSILCCLRTCGYSGTRRLQNCKIVKLQNLICFFLFVVCC